MLYHLLFERVSDPRRLRGLECRPAYLHMTIALRVQGYLEDPQRWLGSRDRVRDVMLPFRKQISHVLEGSG
jgi:hypothetical protein